MKKPCRGTLEYIDGKWWCVGEKIISKWKHSKLNKTNKKIRRQKKPRTRKLRASTKN
jgi:hypothetical protein